jgi:putative DNA primase/helicase
MNDSTNIFSANPENCHHVNEEIELVDLAGKPVWTAWRNEYRANKIDGKMEITKVPYAAPDRKSRSNEPRTWRTLDQAAHTAEIILQTNGNLGGGVGIYLGIQDCAPGLRLAGIDLDTCRDPVTGVIDEWAIKVIKRFNSYAEVSPSQKGVKVFMLYRSAQWEDQIKPLLRGAKTGRQWKRQAEGTHPPAIELYLRARYFATTADVPDGFPDRIRIVEPADLKWLTEKFGPAFTGKDTSAALSISGQTAGGTRIYAKPAGGRDNSNSGRAFRWMRVMHRMGKSYPEAKEILLTQTDDPGVAYWAASKGMDRGEYELKRAYWNAKPPPGSVDDRIGEMAREFESERETITTTAANL